MEPKLLDLNIPGIFYPMIFLILVLIISLILVFYNINIGETKTKADSAVTANILITLFVCLIIVGICVSILPSFKDIGKLFMQIHNVTYVILYTIFVILFYTLFPDKIMDTYAFVIVPISILLGMLTYYKSLSYSYVVDFNLNYERIKMLILLFCLLTTSIVYYNVDPGGLITKYLGYSLILTIVLLAFGLLYLIVLMTFPDFTNAPNKHTNLLDYFTKFSGYGTILYVLFLIGITILISTYPGGFFNKENKTQVAAVLLIVLLISILWGVLLISNLFPEFAANGTITNNFDFFKRALLLLFGIIISSLIIVWIVYNVQHISGRMGLTSFILNLVLVIAIFAMIYKTINTQLPQGNAKKNALFSVVLNTVFYIPCIFNTGFDSIMSVFIGNYDSNSTGYIALSSLIVMLLATYFTYPLLYNTINLQGGKQLVNAPIPINTSQDYGTYETLNADKKYDYNYAISFWFYIDALPPNTSPAYKTYTSLLNYANKPNVLYNAEKNTLIITIKQKDLQANTDNKFIQFVEGDADNRVLYENNNILLQRWNNIIINYSGGVLDVFLNGELKQSNVGVVPYYTLDALTLGNNDGISGKICNVVYFNKSLSRDNMFYLYNMVKSENPPIPKKSNVYIIK
jgi:hypothetical protein